MGGVEIALERGACATTVLRVSGRLRPGWCGNLATGLAGLGIDIAGGHAVRAAAGLWRGEFELRRPASGELTSEDLGRMLEAEPGAGFLSPIELLGYRLEASPTRGGCLLLEVTAPDRVGFLAALLRRLAYHSIFPVELRLATFGQVARDRFWLCGGGGSRPSAHTERAVAASLDSLVRGLRIF